MTDKLDVQAVERETTATDARVGPTLHTRAQKPMGTMKVADFIVQYLGDHDLDTVFELYGAATGPLIDAFTRTEKTKYVAVMNEQAAGFAAEIYAKVSGKHGVTMVTSGPGGQNVLTCMANCFYDSVGCLFITGQVHTEFMRPDPSVRQVGFQECDIVSMAAPVVKYAKTLTDPQSVKFELQKALFIAKDGRPGPVLLDIPLDVQKVDIDVDQCPSFDGNAVKATYDLSVVDRQIDELLDDLSKAKRPVLMVGGGVRIANAVEELRELGRRLKIPCYPTWNATDVVTSDYEYYGGRIGTYGGPGRNLGIQNADLLLAVGTRISGRVTGGNVRSFARAAKKYLVDVDPALLQPKLQQVPCDVNIYCDAKLFLERLLHRLREMKGAGLADFVAWTTKAMEWKVKYDPVQPEFFKEQKYVHPYAFMRLLSEKVDKNAILIGDHGGITVVKHHAFLTKYGQLDLGSNGNAPMGFSFPASMGAWFARPDAQIVCTIGDGGFNLNIQELQTFVNYGINVKIFVINNHIYGITKAFQKTNFQGRAEACGPKGYNPPDFVKVAEAYGITAVRINKNSELHDKFDEVLSHPGPVICDVNCHEYHTYQPRIFGWNTPIEDMYPYLPRDEFRANMFIEPLEGWETPVLPQIVDTTTME